MRQAEIIFFLAVDEVILCDLAAASLTVVNGTDSATIAIHLAGVLVLD